MDSVLFEDWLVNCIGVAQRFAAGRKVAIVLDNAGYHSRLIKKPPGKNSRKAELLSFLHENEVEVEGKLTNKQLYEKVQLLTQGRMDEFRIFAAETICKAYDVELLRNVPYHSEWNPIESLWGNTKHYLRKYSRTTDKIEEIKNATLDILKNTPVERIRNFIAHAEQREQIFMRFDRIPPRVEPVIIPYEEDEFDGEDEEFFLGFEENQEEVEENIIQNIFGDNEMGDNWESGLYE